MRRTTGKHIFEDSQCSSFHIVSSWHATKESTPKASVTTQTTNELYELSDMEMQTGLDAHTVQTQVITDQKGSSLLDVLAVKFRTRKKDRIYDDRMNDRDRWTQYIESGVVTVDDERCLDPELVLDTDFVIEATLAQSSVFTQTSSFKFEETKESTREFRSDNMGRFLDGVVPGVLAALETNLTCRAFDALDGLAVSLGSEADDSADEAALWKTLSVDLEKRRVLYPDWSKARHYGGVVARCTVTRSKERVYDIEYEDGVRLTGVREEYIRLLSGSGGSAEKKASSHSLAARLQEGVRVHVRVTAKNGQSKHFPGRIARCTRSASGSSGPVTLYDVEVEGGGRVESGVLAEDLLIGLAEGQQVEARRPSKVALQCTGVSWNATGNSIAAAYGRNDILGWCDFPGAVCCWNVFGKALDPLNPDLVLDHNSCLMSVAYHPVVPSLVAAGSFNGEVLVWDLSAAPPRAESTPTSGPSPLQPCALSPISEYAHKEPVVGLRWMHDPSRRAESALGGNWVLCSVGGDGKLLVWSLANQFKHPVHGTTVGGKKSSSSQRRYPSAHGVTSVAFSNQQQGSEGSSSSARLARPKWMLLGQEGGGIVRAQVSRVVGGAELSQESFKSLPPVEEVFPPLRKNTFAHAPHIGSVAALEASPFHRNLCLSAGADGSVQLLHLLERTPLRQWEPRLAASASAADGRLDGGIHSSTACSFISAVQFSPVRPTVFAAASSDGLLYLYDLRAGAITPTKVLEAPAVSPPTSGNDPEAADRKTHRADRHKLTGEGASGGRAGFTGLAFNPRQRGLVAACDWLGRVHVWKLGWRLSTRKPDELAVLNRIADVGTESTAAAAADSRDRAGNTATNAANSSSAV